MLIGLTSLVALSSAAKGQAVSASGPTRETEIDARPEPITIDLNKTAVLVIDMQNDFGADGGMFERAGIDISGIRAVVPNVQAALAAARATSSCSRPTRATARSC